MGDYEKDRQGQLARNRAVLAQMGLLNHATTAEMRAPQPRASAGRRPRRTPASRDPAAEPCRRSGRRVKKRELFGDFADEDWHRRAGGRAERPQAGLGVCRQQLGAVPAPPPGQSLYTEN